MLIQLARKEEEEQNPDKRAPAKAATPADPKIVQYISDRLRKLKPTRMDTVLNSIGAMFQFQGGISDTDKEKLFSEFLHRRHLSIEANTRISYPAGEA